MKSPREKRRARNRARMRENFRQRATLKRIGIARAAHQSYFSAVDAFAASLDHIPRDREG